MRGLLAVTILLLATSLAFGQGFGIGANVAGSYNTASSGVEGAETQSGLGYGGGLVGVMNFMPNMGVEVDIQYAMYKYGYSTDILDQTFDYTMTYNSIVIPILFRYSMPMPTLSPYFVVGPSIIYGLSGSIAMSGADMDTTIDIESEDLETDFGIQAGAGADFNMMPQWTLSPYARFQYNLTANDPDTDASESMYDILFGVNFIYKIK
jgi:opacity protein-like surface antigen